ncbi:hypothetical protein, partial [Caldilinea sp.]|uniref:hypothetical protein n=1 Tax=Caldilinea sp. TaxID=2293560 RepID=UPI002D03F556|nr:hypothetical protein [Caldilinea sp.]
MNYIGHRLDGKIRIFSDEIRENPPNPSHPWAIFAMAEQLHLLQIKPLQTRQIKRFHGTLASQRCLHQRRPP